MIVGYHVIFGMYGFWLPNDPRGSWSEFVGEWELFRAAGRATKTNDTNPYLRMCSTIGSSGWHQRRPSSGRPYK